MLRSFFGIAIFNETIIFQTSWSRLSGPRRRYRNDMYIVYLMLIYIIGRQGETREIGIAFDENLHKWLGFKVNRVSKLEFISNWRLLRSFNRFPGCFLNFLFSYLVVFNVCRITFFRPMSLPHERTGNWKLFRFGVDDDVALRRLKKKDTSIILCSTVFVDASIVVKHIHIYFCTLCSRETLISQTQLRW